VKVHQRIIPNRYLRIKVFNASETNIIMTGLPHFKARKDSQDKEASSKDSKESPKPKQNQAEINDQPGDQGSELSNPEATNLVKDTSMDPAQADSAPMQGQDSAQADRAPKRDQKEPSGSEAARAPKRPEMVFSSRCVSEAEKSESSDSVMILSDEEESNTLDQAFVGEESASEPPMVVVEEDVVEVKEEPLKTPAGSLDTSLNDPKASPHSSEELNSSPGGYNLRSRAPTSPFVYVDVDTVENTSEVERVKRPKKRRESSKQRSEAHEERVVGPSTRSAAGWTARSESQERRDREESGPSGRKSAPKSELNFTPLNPDNPLVRSPVRRSPRLAAQISSSASSSPGITGTPTDISSVEEVSSEEMNLNLNLESEDDSHAEQDQETGAQEDASDQHPPPQEEVIDPDQEITVQEETTIPEHGLQQPDTVQQPEQEPEPRRIMVTPAMPDVYLAGLEFAEGDSEEERNRKHEELLQAYRNILNPQSRVTMWYGCPAGPVCPYRSNQAWNASRHYREFCDYNPRRHQNRVQCDDCGETFVNKAVLNRHHKLKRCKALKRKEEAKKSANDSEHDKSDDDAGKAVLMKHRDPKKGDDKDETPAKRSKKDN
jgi:hypothetical protein